MSILLTGNKARKRMVVLGLDGLPLSLAKKLGKSLPNIRRLAKHATTIKAELPELSPVNWTSFYTGHGPEEHGIFGFSKISLESYQLTINDSAAVTGTSIFDILGSNGLVSRIINLPNTYPARPVRGMLIAGFVAHELEKAVYPPFLAGKLAETGYKLEADTNRGSTDLEYLLNELRMTLKSRLSALDMLWPDLAWDLFVHVFTETDRLFHFFMDAVLHQNHPQHIACMEFLAEWDHCIGLFLEKFDALPDPKRLIVMADHGFTEIKTEFCVNTWLKHNGFLKLTGKPENEWDATKISNDSKAFSLDPGRIYIHGSDRFARGFVSQSEYPAIVTELKTNLIDLTFHGEQVLEHIYTGDELYPGSTSNQVPDLVCQARPGFDLKAKFDRNEIFGLHGRTGTHTVNGAIFYDTAGSRPARMRDAGGIVLKYFNISDS